jgi:cold shock CspA family protein
LQRDKDFGFIEDMHGGHWFFHRNHLVTQGEWNMLCEGVRVSFTIGSNHRGPCATQVRRVKG